MKNLFLSFLVFTFGVCFNALTQCSTVFTTALPTTAQNAGTSFTSKAGYYFILNVTAGKAYEIKSSLGTQNFCVREGSYNSATIIAQGGMNGTGNGLVYVAQSTGTAYIHVYTQACATSTTNRTITVNDITTAYTTTSSLPYTQGFNSTTIPVGNWYGYPINMGAGTSSKITGLASGSNVTSAPYEGANYIRFNSYACDAGATARLVSPAISTIGATSVDVEFYWGEDNVYTANDKVRVQYSTNGNTWTSVGSDFLRYSASAGSSATWSKKTVTLPAAAANQSKIYIGFLFTSDWGGHCSLDKATIKITCTDPTIYTVSGGGNYCGTGASTVGVNLSNSQLNVNYQLLRDGVNVGSAVAGTGSSLSFGNQTIAGTYTVKATGDGNTMCANTITMNGSAVVTANPGPTNLSAGNDKTICLGESVTLDGSVTDLTSVGSTTAVSNLMASPVTDVSNTESSITLAGAPSNATITGISFKVQTYVYGGAPAAYYLGYKYNIWVKSQYWNGSTWVDIATNDQTVNVTSFNGNLVNGQIFKVRTIDIDGITDAIYTDLIDVVATYSVNGMPSTIWTADTYPYNSTSLTPSVNPTQTTVYTITATLNGCTTTSSMTVTVNQPIVPNGIVNGDYVWFGTTSDNALLSSNWRTYSNGAYNTTTNTPTITDNVYIPIVPIACGITSAPSIGSNTLNVESIYIENGASFTMTNGKLNVSGNFTNNGTFNKGTGTVEFNGSVAQSINGVVDFNNVIINKSSNEVILNTNVSASGAITLTSGKINLSNKYLDLGTTGSLVNETTTNKVYSLNSAGYVRVFPHIQNGTQVNPGNLGLIINPGQHMGDTEIKRRNEVLQVSAGQTSINRIYDVTPSAGNGNLNAFMEIEYFASEINGQSESSLAMYRRGDGTNGLWQWKGGYNIQTTNSGNGKGKVKIDDWDQFSEVTLAQNTTVLPIALTNFTAICDGVKVVASWTTASEHNNNYFILEKSKNGFDWNEVATIGGAGNSTSIIDYSFNDLKPYRGISYYRLSQVDYNGVKEIFDIIQVGCEFSNEEFITITPNPNDGLFLITIDGYILTDNSVLNIINSSGSLIFKHNNLKTTGVNKIIVDGRDWAKGSYYIKIENSTLDNIVKVIVK